MTCHEFYEKNDYKMNLLGSFVRDHMTKHFLSYEKCHSGAAFESLATMEEKDRSFLACHDKWLKDLKQDVTYELEVKARQIFTKPSSAAEQEE